MLFSDLSLWTMFHGIVLGGGAAMMLFAALFFMLASRLVEGGGGATLADTRALMPLLASAAIVLWLAVLIGTYVTFPPYRATPPTDITDLRSYPRSLLLASSDTAWLHTFAMESKEHMPWIAAMLTTAVAFAGVRHRSNLVRDRRLFYMASVLLAVSFALVAFVSLMGIFINKVAPLE